VRSRRVIQRKVDLTDAGHVFLREARQVLQHSQRAIELTRQVGKQDVVRMGVFKTLLRSRIIDVMNLLTQRVPETNIKLIELPSYLSVQQALLDNIIDLGLTILPLQYAQLSAVSFTKGNMAILLSSSHPLARQSQLTLAQLRHEIWVEIPSPLNPVYESINALCQELGFRRQIVQEVGSLELLADLVQMGKGIGLIPSHFNVSHLSGVVAVPLVNEEESPYPRLELEHVVAFLSTQTSPVIKALGQPLLSM
jgi:DNA-binding transcriptional LysR family regulator